MSDERSDASRPTVVRPLIGRRPKSQVEANRARIAVGLICLAILTFLATILMVSQRSISFGEAKDLLALTFTPIATILGAAVGFYAGGGSGDGK